MGRNHIRKNPMMLISEKIRMLRTLQVERKGCLECVEDPRNRLIYHLRELLARPSTIRNATCEFSGVNRFIDS